MEKITAFFIQAAKLLQFSVDRVISKLTEDWIAEPHKPMSEVELEDELPAEFDSIMF